MRSPSNKGGRGVSPRFHLVVIMFGVNQKDFIYLFIDIVLSRYSEK